MTQHHHAGLLASALGHFVADLLPNSAETGLAADAVDPDAFIRHGFRALMAHRLPRYAAMAERWGVTVEAAEVATVRDAADFDALIAEALRRRGRDAVKLMLLAALMLVAAAVLEGFFRQTVTSTETRLAIGWGIGALWAAWLLLAGRDRAPQGAPA